VRVTGITCSRAAVAARVRLGMHSLKHRVPVTTRGPSWGHSRFVPGAIGPLLEPFCGHLSPKIDKVYEKLTLRYPHEGPCVDLPSHTGLLALGLPAPPPARREQPPHTKRHRRHRRTQPRV
jgi:hypothetical protein